MSEADDDTITLGDNGVLVQTGRSKAIRPDLEAIGDHIAVKVCIQVGAPIVATPTFGVKDGDLAGIPFRCLSILHT